jgi:hypothetical protein
MCVCVCEDSQSYDFIESQQTFLIFLLDYMTVLCQLQRLHLCSMK